MIELLHAKKRTTQAPGTVTLCTHQATTKQFLLHLPDRIAKPNLSFSVGQYFNADDSFEFKLGGFL